MDKCVKRWLPITIILVLYVGLAAAYSFVTPLGEGPDEPGHAAYVFFLAREGRLPDQRANEVPGEGHQPPLAYALAVPAVLWLPREDRTFDLPGNSRFVWAGGDQVNAVAHGSREFWPWQGEVLAWHAARLVSVACGAVAVAMTWLAASNIRFTVLDGRFGKDATFLSSIVNRRSENVNLLAAALVAFNPQFLFVSGLVSNDALLAALGAVALWLCLRGQRSRVRGQGSGRTFLFIVLGVVLGLALLTKQSAVVFVPMIALATVQWETLQQGLTVRRLLVSLFPCLLVFATVALVSGWWYIRNWQLYGDPLGLAVFQAEFATQPFDFASAVAWRDALVQLHNSFWARFGWMNVAPPSWTIGLFLAIELVALIGWLTRLAQWSGFRVQGSGVRGQKRQMHKASDHNRLPTTDYRQWAILLALVATTFVWLLAFARTAGLVAWQGRLLFPAVSGIAILLAAGVQHSAFSIQHSTRWWQWSLIVFAAATVACALWLPFGVIQPAYPPQTLPEQVALERLGTPVYGRFGLPDDPGAELRGYSLRGEVRPGATVELQLIWHARGRQNRDWTVFVHVVDVQGRIVAESNSQPRDGMFPMGQWVKGDWIEDIHTLALPPTESANYVLRVGLFDANTQQRTGVWNEKGRLVGDYLELKG